MPVALGVNGGVLGSNNLPSSGSAKGIWTTNEIARAVALGFWPVNYARSITETATGADVISTVANADPYFNLTTLLLSTTATNGQQNNTFLDSSTNNFTITRNPATGPNAPTQGTFSPFSQTGWGNYFDGTGDYLSVPDNVAFTMGAGDFTIECWVNLSTLSGSQMLIGTCDAAGNQGSMSFVLNVNNGTPRIGVGYSGTVYFATAASTIAANTWVHIAGVRNGANVYVYVNGVQSTALNMGALAITDSTQIVAIGRNGNFNGEYVTGYISNVRIVKGVAVYTGAFTPPTSPLTAVSGTSLLTCQSNRFIDNSTANSGSGFTITVNGNTSVVAFSPFNPTASWSAATYGGSGYFDGSGDYLSVPDNAAFDLGSGDFSIECWAYMTGAAQQFLVAQWANPQRSWVLLLKNSGTTLSFTYSTTGSNEVGIDGTITAQSGRWAHFAAVRNGNTVATYMNGVQVATGSVTGVTLFNASSAIEIGRNAEATTTWNFTGYMSNLRIVKGTAVYTGAFTPPTAPITNAGSTSAASYPSTTNVNTSFASSATSLLLNFTNAGIYDATAKNVLETVGNAQVSTTTSQFPPTSMYFDGTGDYLTTNPGAAIANPGTIWTVEGWFYPTTVLNTAGMVNINTGAANAGVNIYRNGTTITVDNGVTAGTGPSGGTLVANTWQHVAVASDGTSTRLFLDGTQVGSTYTGTVTSGTPSQIWVGTAFTGLNAWTGYMQDVRITKGYARYVTGTGANAGKMVFNGTNNLALPNAAFPVK